MTLAATSVLALLLLAQADAPPLLARIGSLDDASATRLVSEDVAAARAALDDLLSRVDASVHSDRNRPEQRRVQFDRDALALGVRVGRLYAAATGDRAYERRFRAREQRLAGTELLNERRYRDALAPLGAALAEAEALDDAWLETITRINMAYGHLELGESARALTECERAAEASKTLDDRARGLALFNLGSVHLHLGHARQAIDYSRQAVAASREVGIRLWEGNALLNIGAAYRQLGDTDAGRQAFEDALHVLERTSDRLGQGRSLYNLGLVAAEQKQFARAAAYLERALPIIRDVDIRHSHEIETRPEHYQNPIELSALRLLVDAYSQLGEPQKAAAHTEALRRLRERQPPPHGHQH